MNTAVGPFGSVPIILNVNNNSLIFSAITLCIHSYTVISDSWSTHVRLYFVADRLPSWPKALMQGRQLYYL